MSLTVSLIQQINMNSDLIPHLSRQLQLDVGFTHQKTLLPADKLWHNIFQNLKKDHESRTAISMTTQEVQSLNNTIEIENSERRTAALEVNDQTQAAILFTCGHHFTAQRFVDKVCSMEAALSGGGLSRQRSAARGSGQLLVKYYTQQRGQTCMACPACVLSAVEGIQWPKQVVNCLWSSIFMCSKRNGLVWYV